MPIGRVRGVLVERLGVRRGILLSRGGAFYEVWLRGAATVRIGQEAEGVALPRLVTWARRRVDSWPRAAVATAVAFGAVGAVLGAIYLRPTVLPVSPAALPVSPSAPALSVEPVVGAGPAPGPVPGADEGTARPPVRPKRFTQRLEAPKLSVSWRPSQWTPLSLKDEAPWPPPSEGSALWTLRRPITFRAGAPAGDEPPARHEPRAGSDDASSKAQRGGPEALPPPVDAKPAGGQTVSSPPLLVEP